MCRTPNCPENQELEFYFHHKNSLNDVIQTKLTLIRLHLRGCQSCMDFLEKLAIREKRSEKEDQNVLSNPSPSRPQDLLADSFLAKIEDTPVLDNWDNFFSSISNKAKRATERIEYSHADEKELKSLLELKTSPEVTPSPNFANFPPPSKKSTTPSDTPTVKLETSLSGHTQKMKKGCQERTEKLKPNPRSKVQFDKEVLAFLDFDSQTSSTPNKINAPQRNRLLQFKNTATPFKPVFSNNP